MLSSTYLLFFLFGHNKLGRACLQLDGPPYLLYSLVYPDHVRKNIDFLISRTILIRTNNAAKSFYAFSHNYALRIEMVDVIFVQTKHKYFLSAKISCIERFSSNLTMQLIYCQFLYCIVIEMRYLIMPNSQNTLRKAATARSTCSFV